MKTSNVIGLLYFRLLELPKLLPVHVKSELTIPKRKYKDNIKMSQTEVGCKLD
jgi:hypothetical protein